MTKGTTVLVMHMGVVGVLLAVAGCTPPRQASDSPPLGVGGHMPLFVGASPPRELSVEIAPGVSMKFVLIPAGTYLMGSPLGEEELSNVGTSHQVTLTQPFYMGETEVTQDQYKSVMGSNPSDDRGPSKPVEYVTWNDAVEFCRKASFKSGKGLRLPTEAEWEYACRAGTTTPFSTGDSIGPDQASVDRKHSLPVKSFAPNKWGLYDMHGNVWEWCSDWYGPYPTQAVRDPSGPEQGRDRIVRGGSYKTIIPLWMKMVRSAYRCPLLPTERQSLIGFRCAGSVKEVSPEESTVRQQPPPGGGR